ncbi:immunoglobulin lambda-1 light chain-like [Pagrus major]|uniref:immunoglobulin lambda-1 light chain-like n=1 Tax=Pagrus major TaxID=143350 RepID=UPI003CC89375
MLFLPAAALCCLCSALVAMAAQLSQEDLTLTRRVDGDVSFSCRGTNQCLYNWVFWYQKKDTETFTRILRIDLSGCTIGNTYNHPQQNDFSAVNNQNGCELKIQKVKLLHSATYYCSCYVAHIYIFGSGTKLFVSEQVVKPVVSVYPAASRAHLEGNSSLLCVASAMFPPLVRFSWNRRKENEEEWLPAEGEQLELRESGRTAAILLVDGDALYTYKYRCSVQHEGGTVEAQTEQEVPAPAASCPPEREPADLPALQQADLSFQSQCRVKLLCVLYTVLIVKSLVYCCGLSLLMIL